MTKKQQRSEDYLREKANTLIQKEVQLQIAEHSFGLMLKDGLIVVEMETG